MGVHYVTGELSAVAVEDKRVSSVEVRRCLKYGYTLSDSGNCFYYRRPNKIKILNLLPWVGLPLQFIGFYELLLANESTADAHASVEAPKLMT